VNRPDEEQLWPALMQFFEWRFLTYV
jgi:hypothetical protein